MYIEEAQMCVYGIRKTRFILVSNLIQKWIALSQRHEINPGGMFVYLFITTELNICSHLQVTQYCTGIINFNNISYILAHILKTYTHCLKTQNYKKIYKDVYITTYKIRFYFSILCECLYTINQCVDSKTMWKYNKIRNSIPFNWMLTIVTQQYNLQMFAKSFMLIQPINDKVFHNYYFRIQLVNLKTKKQGI